MSKTTDRVDQLLKLNYTIDQAIAITQAEQLVEALDVIRDRLEQPVTVVRWH